MPRIVSELTSGRRFVAIIATLAVGVLSLLAVTVATAPAATAADPPQLVVVGQAKGGGNNRTTHTVRIPRSVRAGDRLVLAMVSNSQAAVGKPSRGWQALEARNGSGFRGRLWTKVARKADAGATVRVRTARKAKAVLGLTAYRASDRSTSVTASAVAGKNGASKRHRTPGVRVADANSWLVSIWGEKSDRKAQWKLPRGVKLRAARATPGRGRVSMVLADSGRAVATGPAVGRTATTKKRVLRSAMFSVVVSPGKAVPNRAPNAALAVPDCEGLLCSFDASKSTDPDGGALTYHWKFGDGDTGDGAKPTHGYFEPGQQTVTLTVSDGEFSDEATRQVSPTVPDPEEGAQSRPGHDRMVPDTANREMPLIEEGEIWDIAVVGDRAFVAGGFSEAIDVAGDGDVVAQADLLAFDLETGLIDRTFRPDFGADNEVLAVEASPDGTKLFAAGDFNSVNGDATIKRVASLDLATGASVQGFGMTANAKATALAVTNSTVYVGGRFKTINSRGMVGLAALNAETGAVDMEFDNQLSGGIGTNGALQVQQLKLTHDNTKLLVVHTARKIDGEDRYGVGLIDTAEKQLLPWRTRLWEDNLQYVGGIQRIYAGDIAPSDGWFVVSSGSGGDRPPINDTAIAFPMHGGDNVQPRWISRAFDSIYSLAITERAIYIGGHFQWNESPTAPDPWPGLDDEGYGTGQGLSGYSLGDAVVRRDHLGALSPADGKALEWHPGSRSIEGNKAMLATPHGLLTGGDTMRQGGGEVGRVAFFPFADLPGETDPDTTIDTPIEGRVVKSDDEFVIEGTATATGTVERVDVEVQRGNQFLRDDRTTWQSGFNAIPVEPGAPIGDVTPWSLPVTIDDAAEITLRARAVGTEGQDPTKATKKIESFSFDDLPPSTSISEPGRLIDTTTFLIQGGAEDDFGVTGVSIYIRDLDEDRYLNEDGEVVNGYTTFGVEPDLPGATETTWQHQVTLPDEGNWKIGAIARDTAGQSGARWETQDVTVDSSAQPPTLTIDAPVAVTPPVSSPTLTMAPGQPLTFSGTATDDEGLATVEVSLRNSTTRENLAADGNWGTEFISGWHQISPPNLNTTSLGWEFETPEALVPGSYSFQVRATDKQDLTTSSSMQGRINVNVTVPGDAPPNGVVDGAASGVTAPRQLALAGTATDDFGVGEVRVAILENDTDRYLRPDGSLAAGFGTVDAVLASPGATSTPWTLSRVLPINGDYSITAYAVDSSNQMDPSTSGATGRYAVYPGDALPVLNPTLASPIEGAEFTDARIFVSGRAEDPGGAIAEVEVAIVNSLGEYMRSDGDFSASERWTSAFLNSPGSEGSNYSYTTPLIPAGAYRVLVRPIDTHDLMPAPREVNVTVTTPSSNVEPVAVGTVSCNQNVCTFDARGSTDENKPTLSYEWDFGNDDDDDNALTSETYTSPGTFTPILTVEDEWGLTHSVTLAPVTIVEPAGNQAPTAVITTPTCVGLVCNFSGATSSDPDDEDTRTFLWSFGDGGTSTSTGPSRTFVAAGTYEVTLTVTDGWGNSSTATRTVTVSVP